MQASYKNALAVGICALTLILTGCAAPAVVNCPPVKEWTTQEEENMALVVNRLPISVPRPLFISPFLCFARSGSLCFALSFAVLPPACLPACLPACRWGRSTSEGSEGPAPQ